MLYEIYFIKHYFFSIINEDTSLMSRIRYTPTTLVDESLRSMPPTDWPSC